MAEPVRPAFSRSQKTLSALGVFAEVTRAEAEPEEAA